MTSIDPTTSEVLRKPTGERPRRVVLVGCGRVGASILTRLPEAWTVVVIEIDPVVAAGVPALRAGVELIVGDGTSRLVLEKAAPDLRTVLIAATTSDVVNCEVARVAREKFGVEERVVLVADPDAVPESAGLAEAEILRTSDAVAGKVINRVSIQASRSMDVGLGIGELVQVTVLDGSPAVGRALKEFAARQWLVGAVYRGGKLIVPHGDTCVAAGDRILLVGDPSVLGEVAPFFRGGAPIFPSQYGHRFGWIGAEAGAPLAEWLGARMDVTGTTRMPGPQDRLPPAEGLAARLTELDIGCLMVDARAMPWMVRMGFSAAGLHDWIVAAHRPVFVRRGEFAPIRRILLAVHDARAQREVVLAAVDLARQLEASLSSVTVRVPGAPVSEADTIARDLDRFGRLHGLEIPHRFEEGNPVVRIRAAAEQADLVVLGVRQGHNTMFSPDVSVFLLHGMSCSALLVPWSGSKDAR